eukprot:scaffold185804_cov21-Tisochrysis_lutea.AAC.1
MTKDSKKKSQKHLVNLFPSVIRLKRDMDQRFHSTTLESTHLLDRFLSRSAIGSVFQTRVKCVKLDFFLPHLFQHGLDLRGHVRHLDQTRNPRQCAAPSRPATR